MKTLTKANIEQLVDEITAFLEKHHMEDGICIYFNNKRIVSEGFFDGENLTYKWIQEENIDPHDYFEYAAYNHILSMSFEGTLYDLINYSGGKLAVEFEQIFSTYLLYTELGNAWNLTAYPLVDDLEVEYTYYNKPEPVIDLYYHSKDMYPDAISVIMEMWYQLSSYSGDSGSCVLGAGFNFTFEGKKYFMHACSPYQGSLSWEVHVITVSDLLRAIGATDISFNYGIMD
jgi:hypothetical protein